MINIILCGGIGTRLWPLSRQLMPKQFLKLFDGNSLFQLTINRNRKFCDKQIIVSNQAQYFLGLNQIQTDNVEYILEPVGRNTAPAITLACLGLSADDIVLVTPSDHLIRDELGYQQAIASAKELANNGALVTFGLKPEYPETGFGYIEAQGVDVKNFHEKPDQVLAKKYLTNSNYYWNSGIFCFKAGVFLDEIKKHSSDIYEKSKIAFSKAENTEYLKINLEDMQNIAAESIDYAVMEKSNIVKMVLMDAKWRDVGSFDALAKELPNDENNNLIISNKVVKTIGITDSIIINSDDVVLVAKKGQSQQVKEIVEDLKSENSTLVEVHLQGFRPWGSYTILEESIGYKVKRIEVLPNNRLSYQSHKFRNEHWVVVSGTATITLNNKEFTLLENQSTYIQAGNKHRLANNTNEKLVIIEAQVGSYTGEDDIKRFDDDYKR